MVNNRVARRWLLAGLLVVALLVSVVLSVSIGSVAIHWSEMRKILSGQVTPNRMVFTEIRLPRVALSILTGINLSLAGLLLQTVLKNPLADPGIMGISAGAALGATLIMLVFPAAAAAVPIVAFAGGMGAFLLILLFAWRRSLSPVVLILAGVAVNTVISGGQSVLTTLFSDRLQGVVTWLNGDLSGKTWGQAGLVLIYSLPAYLLIGLLVDKFNVLSLNDTAVTSLGVPVRFYRLVVATLGVYLAAVTVAQVGLIGFVGLIVPHIARLLVGGNHRYLLPFTVLVGALVVSFGDTIARTIVAPVELPVGTIMSILGGPFFLFLLVRGKRGGYDE
jgi:iron complex transport system permease protein